MVAHCLTQSAYLIPHDPLQDRLDPEEAMKRIGYRFPSPGKREAQLRFSERVMKYANIIFVQYRSQSHLERGIKTLEAFVDFKFHQMSSQLLFTLLTYLGDLLVVKFRDRLRGILTRISG
jgi:hypothetical protein